MFRFRLALALGRTVGELSRMSALEYAHWQALSGLEPIGPQRGDYHAAQITATLAEINRDSKRRATPYGVNDFLLFQHRPEPSDDDIEAQILNAFPMNPGES